MTPYLLKVFGTGQGSRTLDSFEAAWPQIQAALLAAGVPAGTAAGWQRKVRASRNANTVAYVARAAHAWTGLTMGMVTPSSCLCCC